MTVYQCLSCHSYYGYHSNKELKDLKPIDPKTRARYLDSDTWNCPECGTFQDIRDVQPFLGTRGSGMLRQLNENEVDIELLGKGSPGWFDYMLGSWEYE